MDKHENFEEENQELEESAEEEKGSWVLGVGSTIGGIIAHRIIDYTFYKSNYNEMPFIIGILSFLLGAGVVTGLYLLVKSAIKKVKDY